MKIDIHKPDIPKTIRLAFVHYLHESVMVLVGFRDWKRFQPPNQIVNWFLGSDLYFPSHFWFDAPCPAMHMYPLHLEHHWFGLMLDANGLDYPVQYQKPDKRGEIATVTAGSRTFPWIQGDQHLTSTFIMPLLIQSMLRDAQTYITDRTGISDDRWDCLMGEIDSYINSIFKAMKTIKTLKTQRTRHKHYLAIQHDLIKPGYQAMNYLLCLQQGRDLSREPTIVRDSD